MSIPNSLITPSPNPAVHPPPWAISSFSKSLTLFLFCKQVHLYHFRFHIKGKSYISPSLSDLLHSVYCSLGPSMLLQMALFHFLNGWVICHCIYVHLPYPFLCQWTFRLFPCLGSCKQCGNEHWGACIFSYHVFRWTYAQEWDCRVIW